MIIKSVNRRSALKKLGGTAFAAAVATPDFGHAQILGGKPIVMVVGFAPGGVTDTTARLFAPYMSEVLGRQIIVDNRPGAAGNIATQYVANAKADGTTIMTSSMGQLVVNPHTFPSFQLDPLKGLTHISMLSQGDFVLAVGASLPATTVSEFVEQSKKDKGRFNFGTAGAGGINHLMCELFKMRTGADIQSIHYRGSGPMMVDLIGGTIQACVDGIPVVDQYAKQGKLRVLCVAAKKRNPAFPNVPTAAEAGVKDFDSISNWFGLHAPPGTPDGISKALYEAAKQAAARPELQKRLEVLGLEEATSIEKNFRSLMYEQSKMFAEVVRAGNIRAE